MRLVIIESPFQGGKPENVAYLQECILDCLRRGESPYASHQMLTKALDDLDHKKRAAGIEAGFAWRSVAHATLVYCDLGITDGMAMGIEHAAGRSDGHRVEFRRIRA